MLPLDTGICISHVEHEGYFETRIIIALEYEKAVSFILNALGYKTH